MHVHKKFVSAAAVSTFLALFFGSIASAQKLPPAMEARLKLFLKYESKLNAQQKDLLSRSARNTISLAHELFDATSPGGDDEGLGLLGALHEPAGSSIRSSATKAVPPNIGSDRNENNRTELFGAVKISHPEVGLQLSRLGSFTQAGSSTARCGQSIVTGYSSGPAFSLSEIIPFLADPSLFPSSSEMGLAYSRDGGETFTELPFLNAGPPANPALDFTFNFAVGGNASMGCSSSNRFYAVDSPFLRFNATAIPGSGGFFNLEILGGVGINISSDGGQHWSDPAPVIFKNQSHLIDSAWLATDPNDPNRLYVSYTDLDFDAVFDFPPPPANPRCPNSVRLAAEIVTSADGGHTWSSPAVLREDCLDSNGVPLGFSTGPARITVGADGKLSATYVLFTPVFDANGQLVDQNIQINFRQSSDRARSFGPEVKVSDVVQIGDGQHVFRPAVQGFFTTNTIPVIAADATTHGDKPNLYIAWSDGRNNQQPDLTTPSGKYHFGDIFLSRSNDGGTTWSTPHAVSPQPRDFGGPGRDQFLPAIAVDHHGVLAVCYYDRRNDPQNNALDRYCSISKDQGRAFQDIRQTAQSWIPGENWDLFAFWLGDYDSVIASQNDGSDTGFFGSFGISASNVTGIVGRSVRHEQ